MVVVWLFSESKRVDIFDEALEALWETVAKLIGGCNFLCLAYLSRIYIF
jgi:putative AlgH/UPF0301 family transcriptional regulator